MSTFGPTAEDETSEYYAACPECGSRMTHRREGGTWHCHACGRHWREQGGYDSDLPIDDLIMEPCDWESWELWE
jgi:ribosomal protein L37AE/L43A